MVIVSDVGGTKTVFALAEWTGSDYTITHAQRFRSNDFSSFQILLDSYFEELPVKRPDKLCIGVAGVVQNNVCDVTYLPWTIDGDAIAREAGLADCRLLNDLQAAGYGLGFFKDDDKKIINKGLPVAHGTRLLIAPGTGLGEAIVVFADGRPLALPSEGGHADFAPFDETSLDALTWAQKQTGRVSAEYFIRGKGLGVIYKYLCDRDGTSPDDEMAESLKGDAGPIVIERALAGDDVLTVEAVRLFFDFLAAEAGNMAINTLSTGGVYIGGGVVPRIVSLLDTDRFVEIFSAKGEHDDLLKTFPISIALDTQLPLYGAAEFLRLHTR